MALDDLRFVDDVEVPAVRKRRSDSVEQLKVSAVAAIQAPDPFGDGSHLAHVRREERKNAIGFAERHLS